MSVRQGLRAVMRRIAERMPRAGKRVIIIRREWSNRRRVTKIPPMNISRKRMRPIPVMRRPHPHSGRGVFPSVSTPCSRIRNLRDRCRCFVNMSTSIRPMCTNRSIMDLSPVSSDSRTRPSVCSNAPTGCIRSLHPYSCSCQRCMRAQEILTRPSNR